MQLLPGVKCYDFAARVNRKGQGAAILVSAAISDRVTVWRRSESAQAIWLRCDKSIFGLEQDVVIGVVYIPPAVGGQGDRLASMEEAYISLLDDFQEAAAEGLIPLLTGDFNAHIGTASEFDVDNEHCEEGDDLFNILVQFPHLFSPRSLQCRTDVNDSGRALLDIASACGLICTTGRGQGDVGQPSCRGSTRTEHFLMHPLLYANLLSTSFSQMFAPRTTPPSWSPSPPPRQLWRDWRALVTNAMRSVPSDAARKYWYGEGSLRGSM